MTNGTPPQPNAAGGNTWYGGAPPQTPGSSPAWGPTPGFGPAQPGAAFAPPMQPTGYTSTETLLAGLAHLSSLFAPLIAPLLIWLLTRATMPYASRQGKQAFFFHLILSAISLVLVIISPSLSSFWDSLAWALPLPITILVQHSPSRSRSSSSLASSRSSAWPARDSPSMAPSRRSRANRSAIPSSADSRPTSSVGLQKRAIHPPIFSRG